jgi:hypothetical protein
MCNALYHTTNHSTNYKAPSAGWDEHVCLSSHSSFAFFVVVVLAGSWFWTGFGCRNNNTSSCQVVCCFSFPCLCPLLSHPHCGSLVGYLLYVPTILCRMSYCTAERSNLSHHPPFTIHHRSLFHLVFKAVQRANFQHISPLLL